MDLIKWLHDEYGLSVSKQTLSLELRDMGYRKLSAPAPPCPGGRCHPGVQNNFPAQVAAILAALPRRTPIELWWQDEERVGQKNSTTPRWARRGTRPSAPGAHMWTAPCLQGGGLA